MSWKNFVTAITLSLSETNWSQWSKTGCYFFKDWGRNHTSATSPDMGFRFPISQTYFLLQLWLQSTHLASFGFLEGMQHPWSSMYGFLIWYREGYPHNRSRVFLLPHFGHWGRFSRSSSLKPFLSKPSLSYLKNFNSDNSKIPNLFLPKNFQWINLKQKIWLCEYHILNLITNL